MPQIKKPWPDGQADEKVRPVRMKTKRGGSAAALVKAAAGGENFLQK